MILAFDDFTIDLLLKYSDRAISTRLCFSFASFLRIEIYLNKKLFFSFKKRIFIISANVTISSFFRRTYRCSDSNVELLTKMSAT